MILTSQKSNPLSWQFAGPRDLVGEWHHAIGYDSVATIHAELEIRNPKQIQMKKNTKFQTFSDFGFI
jgi:hypothetical protein